MDFIKDKILKIKEYDLNLDTEGEEVLVEKETEEEKPIEESGEKEIPVNEVLEEDGDGDLEDDASEEENTENKEEPEKNETPEEENKGEDSKEDSEETQGEETLDEKPVNVKTMGSWKIENFEEKFNDLQKANTPVQVLTATAEFLKCIMVENSLQSSSDASEETVQKGNEEETQNQDSQNKNDSENQ